MSLQRAPSPAVTPAVAYAEPGFAGRAQRFEAGRYDVARGNLGLIGNDAARSIEVAPGFRVKLCRTSGLAGCITLEGGGTRRSRPATTWR